MIFTRAGKPKYERHEKKDCFCRTQVRKHTYPRQTGDATPRTVGEFRKGLPRARASRGDFRYDLTRARVGSRGTFRIISTRAREGGKK